MSWITLAEADILASLNDAEVDAYRTRRAAAQEDPLTPILTDVTAEVRGYIVTRYPLAATGIPRSLKNAAVDLAIYRLAKRCHAASETARKPAADDAVTQLQAVADGTHGIESDADPLTRETVVGPQITPRTRTHTRAHQDGL
jgi:phage gp36-like protein